MKLSCCSLRRTSRTRKIVFSTIPAMIAPKNTTPRKTLTPSRQLRMIHPLPTAPASPARQTPNVTKMAMVRRRLAMRIGCSPEFYNSAMLYSALRTKPRPEDRGLTSNFARLDGGQFLGRSGRKSFAFAALFLLALEFGKLQTIHILGQSQLAERPDSVPVHVHFVPF